MTRSPSGSKPENYDRESLRTRRRFLLETRAELERNLTHSGDNPVARESAERLLKEFDRLIAEVAEPADPTVADNSG